MNNILQNYLLKFIVSLLFLVSGTLYGQQSNNNAFVFNGESSIVYIEDGQPVNSNAKQKCFSILSISVNSVNNTITVEAWIYLSGIILGLPCQLYTEPLRTESHFQCMSE
jgi:hypothetical protein